MTIFENTQHLDPKYEYLNKYCDIAYKGFWTPAKYERGIKKIDVPNILNKMGTTDQETIKRCILAVLIVEDKVKLYWPTIYRDFPQTIIGDVGGMFGQMEVTHRKAYSSLGTELGVNVNDIKNHRQLNARVKYLNKYLEEDPRIIGDKRRLKRLVLFTSLVERCSLFTQFYILMSYNKRNRGLKTVSSLQQSTAIEELLHYKFGVELIHIVKQDKPQLWDDCFVDLVQKNIRMAYKAEKKLIDWFFEAGTPEHLTKEEVVNFLDYNFACVNEDLGLGLRFEYDKKMYEDKNSWMLTKLYSQEVDFFDAPAGGYMADNTEIDLDEMFG